VADDLQLAVTATRRAGAAVMRHFGTALDVHHKSAHQPVTIADIEADALLRDELTSARPDYGWLSEESRDSPDRLHRSRVWIVDPIDGTRSFIAARPEFSISVALVDSGSVVLGVVYNPATDELFHATRGDGTFLSRAGALAAAVRVSQRRAGGAAGRATLLASRSEIQAGELEPFTGYMVQRVGSTAYKLALVAAGEGDVYVSRGPKSEWDICAGVLLVTEAGGRATDARGRDPVFNRAEPRVDGVLAAGEYWHAQLLEVISTLPAREEI
jgi:myo-inositol-1(or 4)-monophosphatase